MQIKNIQEILNDSLEYGRKYIGEGNVATYIPELGNVNKDFLGISIVRLDGKSYHAGDWKQEFTIQSISKTISLIFALEKFGPGAVFDKVGMESSGDAFNSMVKLESKSIYPSNPFINAGAIAIVGLIAREYKFEDYMELVWKLCGRNSIELDENVYLSEKSTGMLNRSMAYHMKNSGVLETDVEKTLDFYFKTCSLKVNTNDLANYGAILANGGVGLEGKKQLVNIDNIKITKSLMLNSGMYDGSGEFSIRVGMPGKSGVGGGILASVENKMGIGVFGPSLDSKGNSIGGYNILEYLSNKLSLHYFGQ